MQFFFIVIIFFNSHNQPLLFANLIMCSNGKSTLLPVPLSTATVDHTHSCCSIDLHELILDNDNDAK